MLGQGVPALAQDRAETLADIRKQLVVLQVQMVRLRRELEPTGFGGATLPAVERQDQRVDLLEAEFRQLVKKVEYLEHRINRITEDGTRQIRDLEFRLVELEGGDLSQLGEGSMLGGDIENVEIAPLLADLDGNGEVSDLAVSERQLFDAAMQHLENGEFDMAASKFENFTISYPAGPLTSKAYYYLGETWASQGKWATAARAYLDSFNLAGETPTAARALYRLGISFGHINKKSEACVMLNEVWIRYPDSDVAEDAKAETALLECS